MISLTLKDRWKGPHGITYPQGTRFWIAQIGAGPTIWGFKTPGGDHGETMWDDGLIPGMKEEM